ncbi:hypothetical protein B0H14DRAFT_3756789 [Mycena olivaceomarginata]|nr:hypothetical protein B0H14DRAFT_3756789 [Mycena olivaceomarginata]
MDRSETFKETLALARRLYATHHGRGEPSRGIKEVLEVLKNFYDDTATLKYLETNSSVNSSPKAQRILTGWRGARAEMVEHRTGISYASAIVLAIISNEGRQQLEGVVSRIQYIEFEVGRVGSDVQHIGSEVRKTRSEALDRMLKTSSRSLVRSGSTGEQSALALVFGIGGGNYLSVQIPNVDIHIKSQQKRWDKPQRRLNKSIDTGSEH